MALVGAITIAAVLALVVAAPAAADTVGEPNGDQRVGGAGFEFAAEGRTWYASLDVIENRLTGVTTMGLGYSSSEPVSCVGDPDDPTDDFESENSLSFFAEAAASTYAFGDQLSSASGTATITGDLVSFDGCVFEESVVASRTHVVTLALGATSDIQRSTIRSTDVDEDGNRMVFVMRTAERAAAGRATVDGGESDALGQILSRVWNTYPPN